MKVEHVFRAAGVVLALAMLVGCGANKAYRAGEADMRRERWDSAVLNYSKAKALKPGNTRYSVALERAKLKASAEHFNKGVRFYDASQYELAIAEFQQTLVLNPSNQHAKVEMQKAIRDLQKRTSGPSVIEQMKEQARRREIGPPKLDPRSNIPIVLNFQEVEVGKIFDAISKASGINFIYDEKVELDRERTIDVGNVTLQKALDILMLQTKNFYKVIDEHTLLIAPDTRQKRQEYEDQVIRTFFLSNADTKTVVTLLRSLLQSRQIAENPDLNSVTIKDTPPKVAIGERIINANDKAKGEVLVDVELLEINRTTAKNVGIDLSSKTLSLTFRDGAAAVPLNQLDQIKQTGNWTLGVIPSVVLSFLKSDSDTKLIAQPQLRVSEGERAEILIGNRVPIPTTSFNTSQTVGGNIVPITSFTYQNVGITVQIEPRVHHNKEVTLQVQVEISQVTGAVETVGGQAQPIIGTRQIQTVIRLRDGETNLLAGLIQRTSQDSSSGIIGLKDVPGLGRVFSGNEMQQDETDIVMTLTPRIVRIPDITEDDLMTLWVGTEDNMQLRGPAQAMLNAGPFAPGPEDDALTVGSPGGGSGAATPAANPPAQDNTPSAPVQPTVTPEPEATPASNPGANSSPNLSSGRDRGSSPPPRNQPSSADAVPPGPTNPTPNPKPPPSNTTSQNSQQNAPFGTDNGASSGPASVQMIAGANSYRVGDTVVVQVMIDGGNNVGSTPFHLRYNKNVVQFQAPAQEGNFMNSDGTQTVFLAGDLGGGGEIVVGLSRMGGQGGASGSGVLATFQFLAINPGNAGFEFSGASVKDPRARNLPASFNTATVMVQQ